MSLEQTEELEALLQAQLIAARAFKDIAGKAELPDAISPDLFVAGVARAFAMGQLVATGRRLGRRTCRVCGCWWFGACEGGCWWVEADLCSACDPDTAGGGPSTPARAALRFELSPNDVGRQAVANDEGQPLAC